MKLQLEQLEDRTLLATGSPAWTAIGPGPITGGTLVATPGGGDVSGRLTSLAVDPNDSTGNTLYVGSAGGGVWKTTNAYGNGGPTWQPLTDNVAQQVNNPLVTLTVGSLATASLPPTTPGGTASTLLFAGLGEENGVDTTLIPFNAPSVFYGQGILRSLDGGQSWSLVGNADFTQRSIGRIAIDPQNSNIVYASVGTSSNGLTGNEGIWESTDMGNDWTNMTMSVVPDTVMFTDVLIPDKNNPQTIFAAAGEPTGSSYNGLYESTDGGSKWMLVSGFPHGIFDGRITLTASPSNPSVMYASIIASQTGDPNQLMPGTNTPEPFRGLYELLISTNGGTTWNPVPGFVSPDITSNDSFPDPSNPIPNYVCGQGCQGEYDTTLIVNPTNPYELYAGGNDEILRIDLDPKNLNVVPPFTDLQTGIHVDHHAIGFDQNNNLLIGTDGGTWRLANPSTATFKNPGWTDLNSNLQVSQFYGIGANPTSSAQVYGALQDNGVPYAFGTTGASWARVNGSFEDDGGQVWVDPNNIGTVYTIAAGVIIKSTNAFTASPTFTEADTGVVTGSEFLGNFPDTSLLLDTAPGRSNRLWYATNVLWMSTDGANTWTQISQLGQNGWPSDTGAFIDSIAISPSNPSVMYVTARGGRVFMTTNLPLNPTLPGSAPTWKEVDPVPVAEQQANPDLKLSDIIINPFNPLIAYVVAAAFPTANVTGGGQVWMTMNGGGTWQNISGNLPQVPAWSIALDDNNTATLADDVLYVGTDVGVYISANQGVSWTLYGSGLPNTQARSLDLNTQNGTLLVGTWGHSAFETTAVPQRIPYIAVGAGKGGGPVVNVYEAQNGTLLRSFNAYAPAFTGGVTVATADLTGDGIPDIITGAGPGGLPDIRVFDGQTGQMIMEFVAFSANFTGGVYVAAGDVMGLGVPQIIVGADAGGGPHVAVYNGTTGQLLTDFVAFNEGFTGGVRVATGDVYGNGQNEIIAGAGRGGGPVVSIFTGQGMLLQSFVAFDPSFTGGVNVAAGNILGTGAANVIVSAGTGGGPTVLVYGLSGGTLQMLLTINAYPTGFTGGVRVATGIVDGLPAIITGPGPGGSPVVESFNQDAQLIDSFFAFDQTFTGGLYVAGS